MRWTPSAAPWLLAGLALAVRLAWIAVDGPHVTNDGIIFTERAQAIASDGIEALGGLVLYALIIAWAGLMHAAFGNHGWLVWVLAQAVAAALATVPLYRLADALRGPRVAVGAAAIHALLFESFQWESYPLSDSFFQAGVVTTLWLAYRAETGSRRAAHGRNALLLLLAFLRPVGFLVGATFLAWKGAGLVRAGGVRPRHLLALGLVAGLVGAFVAVEASTLRGLGGGYAKGFADGQVLDQDPWARVDYAPRAYDGGLLAFAVANPLAFAGIAALRFLAFFAFLLPRFSAAHVALNLATVLPVVALGIAGAVQALRAGGFGRLLALLVVAFAAFHAVTLLDYDLRYRDPVLPVLGLFAAATAGALARWWRRRGPDPRVIRPPPGA